jgi:beta-glucosidase
MEKRFRGLASILIIGLLLSCFTLGLQAPSIKAAQSWMDTGKTASERADLLVAAMTNPDKLIMMHGASGSYTGNVPAISAYSIPALCLSDGPSGARVGSAGNVTCFPAPINIACTWDPALAQVYGEAMAAEQKGKGTNVHLAPMMNMTRVPQAGRNWEGYGEDPYLAAKLVGPQVIGMQSTGILACAKHFICNDQETNRGSCSSDVDDRTLHEIYLPPFKACVQASVGSFMGAYNRVNGTYCCENAYILNDILYNELGFTGWVMSDWGATHSTVDSANNGLAQEMPGSDYFNNTLLNAVPGSVSQTRFDLMAKRIFVPMFQAGLFDRAPTGSTGANVTSAAHTQTAQDVAAQGLVLLKNTNNVLPFSTTVKKIAVIGTAASTSAIVSGGGSGNVPYTDTQLITALEGITSRAGAGITVSYAAGNSSGNPVPSQYLKTPGGATGLQGQYYNNTTMSGTPVLTRTDANVDFNWNGGSPGTGVNSTNWSVRWTGTLIPPTTGNYTLSLSSDDGSRLYVGGVLKIDNWGDHTDQSLSTTMSLTGGQSYSIEIDYYQAGGLSNCNFRWITPNDQAFSDATTLASQSDVAVVVVGCNASEGSDRTSLSLDGNQDALISAVAGVNTKTIVVVYAPCQILMPWANTANVASILYGGIPGQEQGNALAKVLFGDINPSGKLPFTIALNDTDYVPSGPGTGSSVPYSENLLVGYRGFDSRGVTPLYPFGHGLSYTTFSYTNLSASLTQVSFTLTNTGTRAGAEIAQLYLGFPSEAGEPPKQLKGFQKVTLGAGASQTVTFTLTPDDLSIWKVTPTNKYWAITTGTYSVYVGSSSRDIRLTGSFYAVSGPTPTPGPTAAPTPVNLALNKTAVSSSNESASLTPNYAVDGNISTRWSSAFSDPQWIYVDLGSSVNINAVKLRWEAACGKAYKIQVSNDAAAWTDVYSTTTGDGGIDDITFITTSARYVRMYGTTRGTTYGYSLYEFEIYGDSGSTPPPTPTPTPSPTPTPTPTPSSTSTPTPTPGNLALNKTATASSTYSSTYAAAKAVDGKTSTSWRSASTNTEWIYVDLGATYSITKVVLKWNTNTYATSFKLQTSADAATWTDIYSTTTGPGGTQTLTVSGSGRYVRMYATARKSTSYGYRLNEFEIY